MSFVAGSALAQSWALPSKTPDTDIICTGCPDAAANQPRRHLSVHERGKIILVPLAEVLYLRAELKYVTVRTAQREHLVEESLTRLEEEFSDAFVRIHRNCLVARSAIGGFERNAEESESGWAVVIKATGEKLPVSRRQHHVIKEFR